MKATVIIFIVTCSSKKSTKRKYTTTHRLQQQHKRMKNKPPQVGKKKLSPVPDLSVSILNTSNKDVSEMDKGTKRKLNVESETDDDDDTRENEADVDQVLFTYHFIFVPGFYVVLGFLVPQHSMHILSKMQEMFKRRLYLVN